MALFARSFFPYKKNRSLISPARAVALEKRPPFMELESTDSGLFVEKNEYILKKLKTALKQENPAKMLRAELSVES